MALVSRRTLLESQGKLMMSLGHKGVLARGFALVRDASGRMVRSAVALAPGDVFDVEFADGRLSATAGAQGPAPKPARGKAKKSGGSQGSLF